MSGVSLSKSDATVDRGGRSTEDSSEANVETAVPTSDLSSPATTEEPKPEAELEATELAARACCISCCRFRLMSMISGSDDSGKK